MVVFTEYYTIYERNCTGVSSDCTGDNRECCDLYLEQINRTRIKHDFGRYITCAGMCVKCIPRFPMAGVGGGGLKYLQLLRDSQ